MMGDGFEEHIKAIGYEGCRNCEYQIEPMRMCEWAEHGGDGIVHMVCPMWRKRGTKFEDYIHGYAKEKRHDRTH